MLLGLEVLLLWKYQRDELRRCRESYLTCLEEVAGAAQITKRVPAGACSLFMVSFPQVRVVAWKLSQARASRWRKAACQHGLPDSAGVRQ